MSSTRTRKVIGWLIVGVAYIHISGFMAHYYMGANFETNPTTINKILIKPLMEALSVASTKEKKEEPKDGFDKFVEKSLFYVVFFVWPLFVLVALFYWIVMLIIVTVITMSFVVGWILSFILWLLSYVLLGFKIF